MTQDEIDAIDAQCSRPRGPRDMSHLMALTDAHAAKTGEPLLGLIEAKLIFLRDCSDSEMADGDTARMVCEQIVDAIDAYKGPQFDAMVPEQERLAIEFCNEIAGPLGKPASPPDPVRLLKMAQALYQAEINAR